MKSNTNQRLMKKYHFLRLTPQVTLVAIGLMVFVNNADNIRLGRIAVLYNTNNSSAIGVLYLQTRQNQAGNTKMVYKHFRVDHFC